MTESLERYRRLREHELFAWLLKHPTECLSVVRALGEAPLFTTGHYPFYYRFLRIYVRKYHRFPNCEQILLFMGDKKDPEWSRHEKHARQFFVKSYIDGIEPDSDALDYFRETIKGLLVSNMTDELNGKTMPDQILETTRKTSEMIDMVYRANGRVTGGLVRDVKPTRDTVPFSVPLSIEEIDKYMGYGGIPAGTYTLISAESGVGKSMLSIWTAANAWRKHGIDVCYLATEAEYSLYCSKFASVLKKKNYQEWDWGRQDFFKECDAVNYNKAELLIKRLTDKTIAEVEQWLKIFTANRKSDRGLIVIDLVDHIKIPGKKSTFDEESTRFEWFTDLQHRYKAAVVGTAHVNKGGVGKEDPKTSHIRGTYDKTTQADNVIQFAETGRNTKPPWKSLLVKVNKARYGVSKKAFYVLVNGETLEWKFEKEFTFEASSVVENSQAIRIKTKVREEVGRA